MTQIKSLSVEDYKYKDGFVSIPEEDLYTMLQLIIDLDYEIGYDGAEIEKLFPSLREGR